MVEPIIRLSVHFVKKNLKKAGFFLVKVSWLFLYIKIFTIKKIVGCNSGSVVYSLDTVKKDSFLIIIEYNI